MAFIISQGVLESTEIQETVLEAAEICNKSNGAMFSVFHDFEGEPVVVNLLNIIKIAGTE